MILADQLAGLDWGDGEVELGRECGAVGGVAVGFRFQERLHQLFDRRELAGSGVLGDRLARAEPPLLPGVSPGGLLGR